MSDVASVGDRRLLAFASAKHQHAVVTAERGDITIPMRIEAKGSGLCQVNMPVCASPALRKHTLSGRERDLNPFEC
jgi:hypothetical protein